MSQAGSFRLVLVILRMLFLVGFKFILFTVLALEGASNPLNPLYMYFIFQAVPVMARRISWEMVGSVQMVRIVQMVPGAI